MKALLVISLVTIQSIMAQSVNFLPVAKSNIQLQTETLKQFELLQAKPELIEELIDNNRSNVKLLEVKTPGFSFQLELFEYSIIASDYKLYSGGPGKIVTSIPKNRFRTFRGFIKGNNQSKVSMSLARNFFKLRIDDGNEVYIIEPARPNSPGTIESKVLHLISYKGSDLIDRDVNSCKLVHSQDMSENSFGQSIVSSVLQAKPCNPCGELKICLAADNLMFRKYGSDKILTENQMLSILADVQLVFDDEFDNEYVFNVTGTFVADDPMIDPWFGMTNLTAMLNRFTQIGLQLFGASVYNVATLWTTIMDPSGEVGASFQSSICTTNDIYNVCSDYLAFGGRQGVYVTLQAHMIGHNFSMIHDAGIASTIMAPGLPNGSMEWSGLSKKALNDFVKMGDFLGNCIATCPNSSAPVPEFTSDITYGCQPVTIKFKDLSLNTTKWKWRFPGGMPDSSELQNPVVVYKVAGIYPVTLIAGNHRCEVELTQTSYVEINDVPVANFSTGVQGREVFFIDQSLRADSYLWEFGDGETSEEANPFHVYYTDTTYRIKLTVRNDCGVHTITKDITLVSIPTADFEADTIGACAPGLIYFKDMSSPNSKTWQWEFPGGVPSVSTAKNPVVRYDLPGKYDVKLTVYSSRFNSHITKKEFIIIDSIPVASFSQVVNVGQVDFTSNSRHAKAHFWDFGDGTTSTEANPGHLYTEGDYTVCYVAINNCGTDTLKTNLTIGVVPVAAFQANKQSGCATYMVQFQNTSQSATDYKWTFPGGNPSTSTDPNPLVTYNTKGKYDVSLIASNVFYSDTSIQKDFVEVRSKPEADFSTSIQGFSVKFTDQTIDGTNYIWDFGDNKASFMKNPVHDYGVEGEFNVKLVVQNICGTDTIIKKVAVYLIPKVGFTASELKGCPPFKVNFKDLSSVDVLSWDWQFESGIPLTSTEQNPSVVFDKKGKYAVKLTVRNSNGTNSLTRVQYIEVLSPVECPENTITNRFDFDDIIRETPFSESVSERSKIKLTENEFDFYPNPAGNYAYVKTNLEKDQMAEVAIFSFTGKRIQSVVTNKTWTQINLKDIDPGSYIIRWKTNVETFTKKIIIAKD